MSHNILERFGMPKAARHPRATTTEATRRRIKASKLSVREAAKAFGVNPKTVLKWRARHDVSDAPSVRRERSVVLSKEEETMIVGFRTLTRLPLDDVLYAMRITIPHLTRSSLHRCLQHYGVSRLDEVRPRSAKLAIQEIGHFSVDVVEAFIDEGKFYYFVGTDAASRLFYGRICRGATQRSATLFLKSLIAFAPYKVLSISTVNAPPFAEVSGRINAFDAACDRLGVKHVRSAPPTPFAHNAGHRLESPVARLRDRQFSYGSFENLRHITQEFIIDYDFKKRMKNLKGLTPFEFLCQAWTVRPDLFTRDPKQFYADVQEHGLGW